MELGMRFTYWFDREEECISWYEWFKTRGVPAAILSSGGKYGVFRKGRVMRKTDKTKTKAGYMEVDVEESEEGLKAKVVRSCNGY